jgi:putative NADH-flavin reductase
MPTILVIGASRGIGLETVKAGLAAGHTVRALARSAASIDIADGRLDKIAGDALDPGTIARALAGTDAVIQVLGVAPELKSLMQTTTLFSRGTRVLVDAMRASGPRRLVTVTGIGAGDSRGHGGFLYDAIAFPLLLKRVYDDKDVQERMIRDSRLEWTIVRPGWLLNGPANGKARALDNPRDWRMGKVTRADVGRFLIEEAFAPAHVGKTPLLIE